MKGRTLVQLSIVGKGVIFGKDVGTTNKFTHLVAMGDRKLILCHMTAALGDPIYGTGKIFVFGYQKFGICLKIVRKKLV